MTDKDNQRIGSLFERCVTRREMLLTSGGALAGILLVGCGGGEGAQEESASPVVGTFVGEVSDPVSSVAVIADGPGQGEDAREVRALIYGDTDNPIETDSTITGINEWFVGSAEGNELDLSSEGGAQFQGELTPEGATGTFTLPDGSSVPFDAIPATGVAGYYDVTIIPDGQVSGTSWDGAQLEGRLVQERAREITGERRELLEERAGQTSVEPPEYSIVPIVGTITPQDGQPQDFEVDFQTGPPFGEEPIQARFIVLNDGTIRGGARKGAGTGFTCPLID